VGNQDAVKIKPIMHAWQAITARLIANGSNDELKPLTETHQSSQSSINVSCCAGLVYTI
jgi:hypothetical protein